MDRSRIKPKVGLMLHDPGDGEVVEIVGVDDEVVLIKIVVKGSAGDVGSFRSWGPRIWATVSRNENETWGWQFTESSIVSLLFEKYGEPL